MQMKRVLLSLAVLIILSSHDMYLKLDQYFLEPNKETVIALYNGTFDRSDNVITRDRMIDVSVVGNGKRSNPDAAAWFEREETTYLNITTEAPGTWVAGVSTKPRTFGMSAQDFNDYLKHDGVLDVLEDRKQKGTLGDTAIERYSKHVKTIFQVGNQRSNDYKTELGYPIEFLLLENPYDIHPGHGLSVKLVFNQKPLANQLVYVGHQASGEHTHDGTTHSHEDGAEHQHDELMQLRTDEQGMLNIPISEEGIWYVRTIHLVEVEEAGLTHESNWATVTFAIGGGHSHDHGHDHAHHDHEHEHEEGIPLYVFVLLSVVLIAALFFWFNKKK